MDVKLFKPGQVEGHEWTDRWRDNVLDEIGNWESPDLKTIHVTEGYTGQAVQLTVRRFKPQDGDKLNRSWVSADGSTKSVTIPPYAIVNLEAAKAAFGRYIKLGLVDCCKKLLGPQEHLLWQTYALAIRTMKRPDTPLAEQKLLGSTLDLWMAVRLTTKSFEIVGDETLGMPRNLINDSSNALYGKIPLPPVMGAQIDSVLIHQVQSHLRRKTLDELQKMVCDRKAKTWLTQYLVVFILLHNIALITRHDADYAKKHGMNVSAFRHLPLSRQQADKRELHRDDLQGRTRSRSTTSVSHVEMRCRAAVSTQTNLSKRCEHTACLFPPLQQKHLSILELLPR